MIIWSGSRHNDDPTLYMWLDLWIVGRSGRNTPSSGGAGGGSWGGERGCGGAEEASCCRMLQPP